MTGLENRMASIIYSPKDIFEQDFKVSMRGYDKKEVDVFWMMSSKITKIILSKLRSSK
ncbi:conserved hypothetical protein, partial [Streptococcus agalactiae 515]